MMSMKLKKVEDNKFPIPTTNKTSNPIITNTSTTNNTSTSTKIPVPIPNIVKYLFIKYYRIKINQ